MGDDAPVLEHVDVGAVHQSEIQVVERRQDPHAHGLHHIHDLDLIFDVQVVCGFVQNEHLHLLGQGPGQDDPLLFPAGKGDEAPVPEIQHVHPAQSVLRDTVVLLRIPVEGPLMGGPAHEDHFLHGEVEAQIIELAHDPHTFCGFPVAHSADVRAVDVHHAAGGLEHAVDAFQQRGLAAAVGAQEPHEGVVPHLQGRLLHDLLPGEGDGYFPCFQFHQSFPPNP